MKWCVTTATLKCISNEPLITYVFSKLISILQWTTSVLVKWFQRSETLLQNLVLSSGINSGIVPSNVREMTSEDQGRKEAGQRGPSEAQEIPGTSLTPPLWLTASQPPPAHNFFLQSHNVSHLRCDSCVSYFIIHTCSRMLFMHRMM